MAVLRFAQLLDPFLRLFTELVSFFIRHINALAGLGVYVIEQRRALIVECDLPGVFAPLLALRGGRLLLLFRLLLFGALLLIRVEESALLLLPRRCVASGL